MTPHKHAKKTSDSTTTAQEGSLIMNTIAESKTNPATATTSTGTTPIVVKPPPTNANIPSVPEGTEPTNGTDYRGIVPKKPELAVLGDVVTELQNSAEFTAVFGRSMPSLAYIIQVFTAANEWSLMRNKTDAWDLYSRTQEGLTWVTARALMAKMKPVFDATAGSNADVAAQFPSLGLLLGAAKVIAKRAATARKQNAKAKAKGETATKGEVAKDVRDATRVVADHAAPAPAATQGQEAAGGSAGSGGASPGAGAPNGAAATPAGVVVQVAPAAAAQGGTVGHS